MDEESFINISDSIDERTELLREIEALKYQKEQMKAKINQLTKNLETLSENWEEYLNYPHQIKKLSRAIIRLGKMVINDQIQEEDEPKDTSVQQNQKIDQRQLQNLQQELLQKQLKISELLKINYTLREEINQFLKDKELNIQLKLMLTDLEKEISRKDAVISENNKVIRQTQITIKSCQQQLANQHQKSVALSVQMNTIQIDNQKQKKQIFQLEQKDLRLSAQNKQLLEIQKNLLLKIEDLNNEIKSQQAIIEEQQELLVDNKNDENLDKKIVNEFQLLLNRFKQKLKESQQDMRSGLQNMKNELFIALQKRFKNSIGRIQ